MRVAALALLLTLPLAAQAPRDLAQVPADALHTTSGLAYRVVTPGQGGGSPQGEDIVRVHFMGWDGAGKAFANTRTADHPRTLVLTRLMPGMREMLGGMTAGEQRRIWIPEALAFAGAEGKPKGTVVMDLELLEVQPHPSRAPEDVAGPGAGATVQRSGLASRILRPGTGTATPRRTDWVTVHYTGWTTDGKLFDSSLLRGGPEVFRLTEVIEGWTEGITQMKVGERRRLWVPKGMAYDGEKGKPAGMLVFDVELLGIAK